jgi:hypothetical protein
MHFGSGAMTAARKPSSTDFRERAAKALRRTPTIDFLGEWQRSVRTTDVERGLEVLRAFSLDHLYGRDALPLLVGADVLGSVQHGIEPAEEVGSVRSGDPPPPASEIGCCDECTGSGGR